MDDITKIDFFENLTAKRFRILHANTNSSTYITLEKTVWRYLLPFWLEKSAKFEKSSKSGILTWIV